MDRREPVPTFYLYGEPHRSAAALFLHAESLEERSRPAHWTIRPHSHRELNHLILIAEGGGVMEAEGSSSAFEAPCLLLVPSQVVHGFRWHDESRGSVITLANGYRDDIVRRDPDAAALFSAAAAVPVSNDDAELITSQARRLMRELAWIAPGHRTALDAALAPIIVQAVRALAVLRQEGRLGRGRQAELVARFRSIVEERYRLREPIAALASRLGVSPTTLRVACAAIAGTSPAGIVNSRAFLEAKRALCYSNQTIAEIAYGLGFDDPAYFSRFFARQAGCSPTRFRDDHESVTAWTPPRVQRGKDGGARRSRASVRLRAALR